MSTRDIIAEILAKHPELSEREIQKALVQEKERSGGLIGDETLLRLIAARYGVESTSPVVEFSRILSSGRLISGLSDVSVEGRIVAVFPVHSFGGEKSGKLVNLMVVDEDSILRVVLWNDRAEIVEKKQMQVGQIVRLLHGYTREDRYGKVELHLGLKSRIEISEKAQNSYPSVEKFVSKISEIVNTLNNVHLSGRVREVFGSKTFTKGDGTEGKFMRFTLTDDSAEISVVVWNGMVGKLERQLKSNVCLYLINGKVKEKESSGFEVHVDSTSFVYVQSVMLQMIKLADLKEGEVVSVEGNVSSVDPIKEVTTGRGEQIKLFTFDLRDETGLIRVSVWRSQVEQLCDLKLGDKVIVENGFVKKGYGDKLELTTRSGTQFKVVRVAI
ncbi:MAG: OB-fold nucleic acid binding domain-containing protein [Candidatus Bathyarchaeota archaeon]|nr:OB-fold nucleic acid binding domain-containing protein [Candidatus Termiticorpusculum sp.]